MQKIVATYNIHARRRIPTEVEMNSNYRLVSDYFRDPYLRKEYETIWSPPSSWTIGGTNQYNYPTGGTIKTEWSART